MKALSHWIYFLCTYTFYPNAAYTIQENLLQSQMLNVWYIYLLYMNEWPKFMVNVGK